MAKDMPIDIDEPSAEVKRHKPLPGKGEKVQPNYLYIYVINQETWLFVLLCTFVSY